MRLRLVVLGLLWTGLLTGSAFAQGPASPRFGALDARHPRTVGTAPAADPILDQQNILDGTIVGLGIGRFNDMNGLPDPDGTQFDLQDAQSFTVGIAGALHSIKVPVISTAFRNNTLPVTLEVVRLDANGSPDNGSSLGQVSLPTPNFKGVLWGDTSTWPVFDVSGLGIFVEPGDRLAFTVRTEDTVAYLLNPERGVPEVLYPRGSGFRRNHPRNPSWGAPTSDYDFGFQVFVSPRDPLCETVTEIPGSECDALLSLFASTNGPAWTHSDNWLSTNTPCTWFGISCADQHVTAVILLQNNLTGTLPIGLSRLTHLRDFEIWNNRVTGPLPVDLGSITSLTRLGIAVNAFTGPLPDSYGNLSNLLILSAFSNQLTGGIPASYAGLTRLQLFQVQANRLDGVLPAFFADLAHLSIVQMADNSFSGVIPTAWANSSIAEIDLRNNLLSGTIPPSFGTRPTLAVLKLNRNQFEGLVPLALAQFCTRVPVGSCILAPNLGLCLPDLPPFAALGVNEIGGLPLSNACGNAPPLAVDDAFTTAFDNAINLPVLGNDSDPDGHALQVAEVSLNPGHGTAVINPGSITVQYRPDAGFVGEDRFRYTVSDLHGGAADGFVTMTVLAPANQFPHAEDDQVSTAPDTPVTVLVLANDSDPDADPLAVFIAQTPAHGTVEVTDWGTTMLYTPAAGYVGADSFVYQVSDGRGGTAFATVYVTVVAPVTLAGHVTFRVDMNREIRLNNLRPGRTVGLMGGSVPLSWSVPTVMGDADADGIYEGTVAFDLASGTPVQYKYVISADGTLTWEGSVGPGDSGNRVLPYAGTATIATVFFNNVSGVAAESSGEIPTEFALSSVYPNPFNPTARVAFDMAADAPVRIEVADAQGRVVRLLLDGMQTAGRHEVTLDAGDLPSGIYLVTMRTGSQRFSRTVALVR